MAEHCELCQGTGKRELDNKMVACLHCTGTGIEPETKTTSKAKSIGPFHAYPLMRRDAVILVGLIVFLFLLKTVGI